MWYAPLAQLGEALGLDPSQCGFESHGEYCDLGHYADVAERKTRLTQNQVSLRACGFESHLRYAVQKYSKMRWIAKHNCIGSSNLDCDMEDTLCHSQRSIAQTVERTVEARGCGGSIPSRTA